MLQPWRWSYAFVALFYPFYIEYEIPIRFFYNLGASTALLLRFFSALAVSATIRVILTKISNRSGVAVGGGGGGGGLEFVLNNQRELKFNVITNFLYTVTTH